MSAQVTITSLPQAGAITGTESVPIVQNGVTVQTTTGAIAGSPSQAQTFITLNQEPTLPNSRYIGATNGLTLTASSPQGVVNVTTTGALSSLVSAGTGLQAKTDGTTVVGRTLTAGTGVTVANGDGVSGNPSVAISNTGVSAGSYTLASITVNSQGQVTSASNGSAGAGTVQQINTGTGLTGGPITSTGTVSIANTAVTPGSYTTANITVNAQGQITAAASGSGGVTSVTGTANEVAVSPTTGAAVVSLPSALTFTGKTITGGTYASPAITGTVKLTGTGASSYTPFAQTFSSASTNFNGYQLNYIQNVNNGSDASVDYVAYNDASDVDSYFIDMGISSSNYTNATYTIFPANGGYVYTGGGTSGQASALLLGTSNSASDIILFSGGTLLANTRATVKGNTGNVLINTSTDTGYKLNVNGTTYFGGASTFGGTVLLNADPTLALQAATKQYVDASAGGGFVVHPSVVLASVAALPSCTYSNGASGVGATLTATANGALSIDATAVTAGIRVLVKDQAAGAQNGVYTVTQEGSAGTPFILTRATDFDTAASGEIANNAYFFVTGGATQAGDSYVLSVSGTITVGTTALTFTLFADQQAYTGGTNITVAGQVINVSGTIAATLGGTGTSTVTTGDLLYGSGTNTWSKLPIGIGYKSLMVNAGGTQVEWNAVPLNQLTAVSGQLGTGNGGTGLSTFTANGVVYASSTSALATGSALTFDGSTLETYSTVTARAASGTSALRLRNTTSDYQWQTVAGTNAVVLYDNAAGSARVTLNAGGGLSVGTTTDPGTGNIGLAAGGKLQYSSTAYITPEDNSIGARISAPGVITMWTGATPAERVRISSTGELTTTNGKFNLITVGYGPGAVSTNTAIGSSTLSSNTTGSLNTAVGYEAGLANTTAAGLSLLGFQAGAAATGGNITAVGYQALWVNTSGLYNTAIGQSALQANTAASNNTAVGYQAGYSNTSGTTTAVGFQSGRNNTTGAITSVGDSSLRDNTTGTRNTAIGSYSQVQNSTGSYNTSVGDGTLFNSTTASNNTAVGYQAGYSNTIGLANTFVGYQAGYSTTGGLNTFVGNSAGYSTTGSYNTFVGMGSVSAAGYLVTTGARNTILGGFTGNQGGLDIRTASNFIVLSDGDGNPRGVFDASGVFSVAGGISSTRVNPRFLTATTGTSVTPDISLYDQYNWTALASNFTFNAPTGTPVNGNKLMFRITPSGTPTLTWNATYTPIGVTLPTTTTSGKTVYVGCVYNADLTRWDVIAVSTQA